MKSMKLGVAVQRLWCSGLLVHVPARSRTCSTLCNHSPLSTERCVDPVRVLLHKLAVLGPLYEEERGSGRKAADTKGG
jgi:hypothetical protein